jgi:hypothetical protein
LIGAAATPLMAKPRRGLKSQQDPKNKSDDPTTFAVGPGSQNSV